MRILKIIIPAEVVERQGDTDLFDEIQRVQDDDKLNIVQFAYEGDHRLSSSAFPENEHGKKLVEVVRKSAGEEMQVVDLTENYAFGRTNAPGSYDGFGTLTVAVLPGEDRKRVTRVVAMLREHEAWQRSRYRATEFYSFEPLSSFHHEDWQNG